MLINDIVEAFCDASIKRDWILLRAIRRYYVDKNVQVCSHVKNMLHTKYEVVRKLKRISIFKRYGCDIGLHCKIGGGISLPHSAGVVIGDYVEIGKNCTLYQNVTLGKKDNKYPTVGDNVTIFPSSIIIGGIHIGDDVVIGAGSVVLTDIPQKAIVAGNPARIIKFKETNY